MASAESSHPSGPAGPQLSPPADMTVMPNAGMSGEPSQAQLMAGYQQYLNQIGMPNNGNYVAPAAPHLQQQVPGYYVNGYGNGGMGSYEDPNNYAAYMAAVQQQQAASMYGGYPGAYGGPMAAGLYGSSGYPGPAYYDPHGMINPAACVAPVQNQVGGPGGMNKCMRKKKNSGWCC